MLEFDINRIMSHFLDEGPVKSYGNGHINDTYISQSGDYILQKINTKVFKDYNALMENIVNVTEFLKEKILAEGGDPDRETLTVVNTISGKSCHQTTTGEVFRVYKFIKNSRVINVPDNPTELYHAAKGFGKFQKMLDDFPADKLHESIPDFHNTPVRFKTFEDAVLADKVGRVDSVKDEIDFAMSQKPYVSIVCDGIADGSIPLRVTHNDTKINNLLFDKDSDDAICVIDLDTVMPGSLLYDFGDALRIGGATADEDETDLSKVMFNVEAFRYFTRGFVEQMHDSLTDKEAELLAFSAKLITLECGIRFLTDYLDGDNYFKIHRPNHNLDRARTQFKLVREIDNHMDELNEIVKEELERVRCS